MAPKRIRNDPRLDIDREPGVTQAEFTDQFNAIAASLGALMNRLNRLEDLMNGRDRNAGALGVGAGVVVHDQHGQHRRHHVQDDDDDDVIIIVKRPRR